MVWGLGPGQTGVGLLRLHGATLNQLLCSRIRIVDFILNSKTKAGGEDGLGRWLVQWPTRRVLRWGDVAGPSLPSLLSDRRLPVTLRHIPGLGEGWGL